MTNTLHTYDDIIWVCTNLCELIEFENDALANRDMTTIEQLAENKLAMVQVYEQSVLPLAEDPSLAETLEEDQREELKALGLRLRDLVTENATRLSAAMEATRLVMDSIVAAAKKTAPPAASYNRKGFFGEENGLDQTSLSLDKKF